MAFFWPARLVVEEDALQYKMGRMIYDRLRQAGVPIEHLPASGRSKTVTAAKGPKEYQALKRMLVLAVRKRLAFEPCQPSADFHLPLAGGCPGACQYCYLASTFEMKPFIRLYVNLEEILAEAAAKIRERMPEVTFFEGSSTSDILALEHLGGSAAQSIEFFAGQEYGRFRFVTKFSQVQSLLELNHGGHTKIRFSINSVQVSQQFEQHTATLQERMEAARRVADAGYPLGIIMAPIIRHEKWREGYAETLDMLAEQLGPHALAEISFELIQYRFTPKSRRFILQAYPGTKLPLNEKEQRLKAGRFPGAGKYVYPREQADEIKFFLEMLIRERFPAARIDYFT